MPHAACLFDWQFHSHLHLHFPFAVNLLEKRAPKVTAGRGAAVNLTLGSCRQKFLQLHRCCRNVAAVIALGRQQQVAPNGSIVPLFFHFCVLAIHTYIPFLFLV